MDRSSWRRISARPTAIGQISFNNDNWDIILFGNNLTDEDTPLDIQDWPELRFGGNRFSWRYRPRLPREIGLRLNYTFQASRINLCSWMKAGSNQRDHLLAKLAFDVRFRCRNRRLDETFTGTS